MTAIQNETELEDCLRGTNFFSASGGGEPDVQQELLLDDMARGVMWSRQEAIHHFAAHGGPIGRARILGWMGHHELVIPASVYA
jgi:hypothetical protein